MDPTLHTSVGDASFLLVIGWAAADGGLVVLPMAGRSYKDEADRAVILLPPPAPPHGRCADNCNRPGE